MPSVRSTRSVVNCCTDRIVTPSADRTVRFRVLRRYCTRCPRTPSVVVRNFLVSRRRFTRAPADRRPHKPRACRPSSWCPSVLAVVRHRHEPSDSRVVRSDHRSTSPGPPCVAALSAASLRPVSRTRWARSETTQKRGADKMRQKADVSTEWLKNLTCTIVVFAIFATRQRSPPPRPRCVPGVYDVRTYESPAGGPF